MNFSQIEKSILKLSRYVKEISIINYKGNPFAIIYPDFEKLSNDNIINIENEIRWYAVELFNMYAKEDERIKSYKITTSPLPRSNSGNILIDKLLELIEKKDKELILTNEPNDEIYKILKKYIFSLCKKSINPSSHLELDIGLDSLNYVQLFIFIEDSFGIKIDETIFSKNMTVEKLYNYIVNHKSFIRPNIKGWKEILDEEIDYKLEYSPFVMFLYKYLLLPLFKLYFRLEINGIKNIPKKGNYIIAPSHQSMLDGFLMVSSLPYEILRNTFFLAYKQVFGKSILEPVSKHGQTILIDADNDLKNSLKYSAFTIKEGKNLVIFPEGARTRDRELLDFHPFFAMLSKIYNVPIVPVMVDGSFEALGSGRLFPRPKKIKISYLEPIYPQDLSIDQIIKKTKDEIQKEIDTDSVLL